jgi:predicted  nucleic acid-binding Zn-ribbon protein
VEHLKRRIGDLEDAELEIMEQLETAGRTRARLGDEASELDTKLSDATARRDQALGSIDADVAARRAERAKLEPLIPADLLALYVKIGASHGGVGAAELRQRRCTGCQLEVNIAELQVFATAAEDDVLRCEECSRILVRTASSGV